MTNYIEQAAETTEADQAIQAHLRQACEHKIALHVDAAIDVVDTDPAEADAWAYEAGKEAWEFDIQTPEKLASHPALSAAFKRGFDSVEQQSRSQRDVSNYTDPNQVYETGSDDTFWNSKVIRVGERFNVQVFDADGDRRPDREDSFADQALAIAFAGKSVQRYSGREVAERIVPANSLVEYRMLLDRWRTADGTAKSSGITDSIRAAAVAEVEAVAEALRLSPFGLDEKGRVAERKMSNYTQRQETIDALASMVIEQADRHGFKIEIDAIRDAVEQMAKFAGIEANETEFMLASQKVEDEARLMGKLSEKSGEMENPQERYRLSAMDEGNDHYSVLDTKTQLYWSSEGWQRPDSGWASVLTRSEAARKAYELNRKLSNYIDHPASGKTGTFAAKYDQHAERNGQTFTVLGAVDPKTYDATECGEMFSIRFADGVQIDAWPEEVESAMNEARLVNNDEEVVVKLADGCTLRSGVYDPHKEGALTSGEYVRLCGPDGEEILYWDQEEWANDPALVMGAIMNAAAGLRVHHVDSPSPGM